MQTIHNFHSFHWHFWLGNFSCWRVFRSFLGICCPISIKEEIDWYILTGTRRWTLVKMQQFLEINGCNVLQHSFDRWTPLGIVAMSCLSYIRWDFWIYHWQENYKAQLKHSSPIHENYTFCTFYMSTFLTSLPLAAPATETWYHEPEPDLFHHSRQSEEKQLLTQCSFMAFTVRL